MRSPWVAPSRGGATSTRDLGLSDELVERVLVAVECVPTGCVVSYGDIAAIVGTGPRVVGRVMALYGAGVAWWRVTNATGHLPVHLLLQARERWASEGIAANAAGTGCKIVPFRADLATLRRAYELLLPPDLAAGKPV